MASESFAKISIIPQKPKVFFPNKEAELLIPALTGEKVNGITKTEILGYNLNPGIYSVSADHRGNLKFSKIKSYD